MKSSFETRLFLLCIAVLIVFQGLIFAFAEDDTTESSEDNACAYEINEKSSVLIQSYETFLNEFFLIDTPTSNQVENAMDYYRFVEDSLYYIYSDSMSIAGGPFSKDGNTFLDSVSAEVTYCSHLRDQYIQYAQALLQKQVINSASSKRTFKVIDGLKIMNKDLGDFSEQFLETFPGIFNQMNNALPCYAHQCILK